MKIDFEFDTQYGVFRDALHLPDDHTFTSQEIENMKQQRLENWIAMIESPPPPVIEDIPPPPLPTSETISIAGETYQMLHGAPPSGAKLVEISGVWYYKV